MPETRWSREDRIRTIRYIASHTGSPTNRQELLAEIDDLKTEEES